MALSAQQRAELKRLGYSDGQISAMELNPQNFTNDQKFMRVYNNTKPAGDPLGGLTNLIGSAANSVAKAVTKKPAPAMNVTGIPTAAFNRANPTPQNGASGTGKYDPIVQRNRNATPGDPIKGLSNLLTGAVNNVNKAVTSKDKGLFGNLADSLSKIATNAFNSSMQNGAGGAGGGDTGYMGDAGVYDPGAAGGTGEGAYQPAEYQVPVFERRDFTDKANDVSKNAFAPAFEAIVKAAANAEGNYKKSDERVASLYQNLVNNIAGQAAKTQESYNQQAAASQQATGNLQQSIADTYNQSGQATANLLQSLGLNAAAGPNGGVLNQGASDSAYQQAQAQLQGAANTNAINQQGAAQGDYLSSLGLASQAEGNVSRRDLLDKLSNQLAAYDQQNLQLQSQQRTTAMDMANQLSDKDLELQQLNANAYTQGYNINNQNAQQQVQFGQSQQQINNQASQAAADSSFRSQQARQDQFNNDRNYDLQSQQLRQTQATNLANLGLEQQKLDIASRGSGSGGSPSISDLDPYSKVNAQAATAVPNGQGKQYVNLIDNFVRSAAGRGDNVNNYASNPIDFMLKVSDEAARAGLDPDAAQSVAASYYQNILRKQSDQ